MLLPSLMKVEMCCTLEVMTVSVRLVLSECFLFLFAFLGLTSLESSVSSKYLIDHRLVLSECFLFLFAFLGLTSLESSVSSNRSYNYHKFSV